MDDLLTTGLLAFLLFLVFLHSLLRCRTRRVLDIFEPILIVSFLYFIYFGVRAIFLLCSSENPFHIRPETVNLALVYAVLGIAFMHVGYYSRLPIIVSRNIPKSGEGFSRKRMISVIVVLYVVGLLARITILNRGWYFGPGLLQYRDEIPPQFMIVNQLSVLSQHAFMLALIYYFYFSKKSKPAKALMILMVYQELFFAFLHGTRSTMLYPMVSGSLIWFYSIKKPSKVHVLLGVFSLVSLAVFVIFPLSHAFRFSIPYYEVRTGVLSSQGIDLARRAISKYFEEFSLAGSLEFALNRFAGIDSLGLFIEVTGKEINFQYGKTFLGPLIASFIPRVIWTSKYQTLETLRMWRAEDVLTFEILGQSGSMVAPTQIGDLYLNFHLPGILIGMFLYGVLYRVFYIYFVRASTPLRLFPYAVVFYWLVLIEGGTWYLAGAVGKNLLISLAICSLISMKSAKRIPVNDKWLGG